MDSSVFSVIFDNTDVNDPSLVNDIRKNHLSVYYCFSIFFIRSIPLSLLFFPFFIQWRISLLPGLFSPPQLHTDVDAHGSGSLQRSEQIVLLIEFLQKGVILRPLYAFLLRRVSDKVQTHVTAALRLIICSGCCTAACSPLCTDER